MQSNFNILKFARKLTIINAPITESEGLGWQMKETREYRKPFEVLL